MSSIETTEPTSGTPNLKADLEQRLGERIKQLEEANSDLEGCNYAVARGLQAPLQRIKNFVGLMRKQYSASLDQAGRRYLDAIDQSAVRMIHQVDDIIEFSRVDRVKMRWSMVSIGQLVLEARAELQEAVGEREVEWSIGALPAVLGDRQMLRSVMVHLISNAVKFTRPRSPARIEVTCTDCPTDCVLSVRDNGVGFDMGQVERLFVAFQRLPKPEEFEGAGMGLAIVRRIVERHGGRVWAEGELDEGACFYVALPKRAGGQLPE